MAKNKVAIVILTVAMNACGVVMAHHVFAAGSSWAKAVAVLGAVLSNLLALFGAPVLGGAAQSTGLQLPDDKAGPINVGGGK